MHLFPRLLIIFLTLILIPMVFVTTLIFTNARSHIRDIRIHSLEAIADFRVGSIERFEADQRLHLKELQKQWIIQSKLPVLERHLDNQSAPSFLEATRVLKQHFDQFRQYHDHDAVVVFDSSGRIAYSDIETQGSMPGLKTSGLMAQIFKQAKGGIYFGPVQKSAGRNDASQWIGLPVMVRGRFLGAIALQVSLQELLVKFNSRKGLGDSGEVVAGYLQGEELLLINALRHESAATFLSPKKIPVFRAAGGQNGFGLMRDYRNKEVIAVWRHIPSLRWAVVVKIDADEAFHPVYELRRISVLIGLIALMFGILMAWVLARTIASPVNKLARGAAIIGSGQLDYRLDIPGEGEFSDLAGSFNRMAEDMSKAMDERVRIMTDLAASEERFRTMVASLSGVVYACSADLDRSVEFVSTGIKSISGIPLADFLSGSQNISGIMHSDDLERVHNKIQGAIREMEPYTLEYRIVDTEGKTHWVLDRGRAVHTSGSSLLLYGVMVDISGQKLAEEELRASYRKLKQSRDASFNIMEDLEHQRDALRKALEEREVLLREIHHRVKNNMQIISAMLELQAGYTTDNHIHEFFEESQARIKSMALVHEKLYRQESLSRINFGEYMQDLVDGIMAQYPPVLEKSAVNIDVGNIMLPIDKAIPCGLIVNELVSNIFKHAFPDKRSGRVEISMQEAENSAIILTVKDNGIGLPKDMDIHSGKTFGMYIIHSLAERQLGGSIEMSNTHGTSFIIRFSREDRDE